MSAKQGHVKSRLDCAICRLLLLSTILLPGSLYAQAGVMNLQQVLQQVIDHYPSVETALIQVRRARLSAAKSQSLLGWQLQAQAGIQRDASPFFGTALDIINVNGKIFRQLDNGGQLGIEAGINRQNSEDSFSVVPNPATSTSVDLNYRHPLARGADNPVYAESGLQAAIDEALAKAQRTALYDQLAQQLIELYISAVSTRVQQQNLEQAIARSLRRQRYLKDRADLGLAEDKDLLQVDAQIKSQRAELKALEVLWQNQRIRLNRLMGRDAGHDLQLSTDDIDRILPTSDQEQIEKRVIARNAELISIESRLQLADSNIRLRRDAQQDQLDLVMFVGNRTIRGDVVTGTSNESELVGGVRLEFQQQFDKHAVDAELQQAILDRDIALLDRKRLLQDIHYDVASLLAQIQSGKEAWHAWQTSVKSEQSKLHEAEQRYRSGRSDTEQLIAFESQLANAELSAQLRKLDLLKNALALKLLTGELWNGIHLPDEGGTP